jgi:hypothetical protein
MKNSFKAVLFLSVNSILIGSYAQACGPGEVQIPNPPSSYYRGPICVPTHPSHSHSHSLDTAVDVTLAPIRDSEPFDVSVALITPDEDLAKAAAFAQANDTCHGNAKLVSKWAFNGQIEESSCAGGPQNPGQHPCTKAAVILSASFSCE